MQKSSINIKFYIIVAFFLNFFKSLMAPFWLIYFNKIGLTFEQISFLVIVNHLAIILFEIPTGAMADMYSRKLSVILSLLIGSLCSLGIYFNTSFRLLLFFHLLAGIGATFMSGAFDSWFAESCFSIKKDIDLTPLWGQISSFSYMGATAGFLIGSLLVHHCILREIWFIEGMGIFAVFIYVFVKGKEPFYRDKTKVQNYRVYLQKIIKGSSFIFKYKKLFFITLGSSFFFFSSGIISLMWQPYFKAVGIPLVFFGPILAATMIISIFMPRFADIIKQILGGAIRTLMIISIVCSLFLLMMLPIPQYSFISYIIYTAIYSLHTPIFMAHFNKLLPSSERATIISTYNQFISIATILATYLFGYLSDYLGLQFTLLLSSFISIISVIFFGLLLQLSTESN